MMIYVVKYGNKEQYGVHKKEGVLWRREYALDIPHYTDCGVARWRDLYTDLGATRTHDACLANSILDELTAMPVPVHIIHADDITPNLTSINDASQHASTDGAPLPRSYRGQEWLIFSDQVLSHIESYTVPQYGDYPDDQLAKTWSVSDCITAIAKYAGRYGRNSRGDAETDKDLVKIAHYACVALMKRRRHEPSGL